jgi:predicted acylesterase/phospholipase RssA
LCLCLPSCALASENFSLQYQTLDGKRTVKPWDFPTRPKIGVALSGGLMVRGLMHIGVIQALHEEGIPIDYLAGTSMGAILGGLVANGYSPDEIKMVLGQVNWNLMMSDDLAADDKTSRLKSLERRYALSMELDQNLKPVLPLGLSQGHYALTKFSALLEPTALQRNFDEFAIPFRAVIVNLATGEEKVVDSGYLSEVLRASSSVPLMFAPMNIDGNLYIDGGILNNLPTDVVKTMGADIVIGSNVLSPLARKEEFSSFAQVLSQTLKYPVKDRIDQNRKLADILVEPDLTSYGAADFSKISDIAEVGRADIAPKLQDLKTKLNLAETQYLQTHQYSVNQIALPQNVSPSVINGFVATTLNEKQIYTLLQKIQSSGNFSQVAAHLDQSVLIITAQKLIDFNQSKTLSELIVREVAIKGASALSSELIKSRLSEFVNWTANPARLQKKLDEIYATGRFHLIYPRWDRLGDGLKLTIVVIEKESNSLRMGARLDNEEGINVLANLDLNHMGFFQFQNNLELGVGENMKLEWNLQWFPSIWDHYVALSSQFYARDRQIKSYDSSGALIDIYHDARYGVQAGAQFGITQFDVQSLSFYTEKLNYRHYPAPAALDTAESKNGLVFKSNWEIFPKKDGILGYHLNTEINQFTLGQLGQAFTKSTAQLGVVLDYNVFLFSANGDVGMSSAVLPIYEQYIYGGEGQLAGYHHTELRGSSFAGLHAKIKARMFQFSLGFLKNIDSKIFYDRASVGSTPDITWGTFKEGWGLGFEAQSLGNFTAKLNFEFSEADRRLVYLAFGNEF